MNKIHPYNKMTEIELIEMNLEWEVLVEEMSLNTSLGQKGFDFSKRLFKDKV